MKIIDLTHTLSSTIPTWDGGCGFTIDITTDYKDCPQPDVFRVQRISCNAGIGTHIDSPAHVVPEGTTIDKLGLDTLVTDCVCIDVRADAHESYVIPPSTITDFEKRHGHIPENCFVLLYTGWDARWDDTPAFINDHVFPSVDVSTAQVLLDRNIAGLGIDTLSADTGKHGFPVHRLLLGANKYLVENVANAKELPATGAKVFVLPMKIGGATEAPVRLIAVIPDHEVLPKTEK